jgi:hypothetical protein
LREVSDDGLLLANASFQQEYFFFVLVFAVLFFLHQLGYLFLETHDVLVELEFVGTSFVDCRGKLRIQFFVLSLGCFELLDYSDHVASCFSAEGSECI